VTSYVWNKLEIHKGKGHPVTCYLRRRGGSRVIVLPILNFGAR